MLSSGEMAEESVERASLTCAVCLDLLSNPVTIPCGHSFCFNCIQNSWREVRDRYACPQCRKRFISRPELNKNIMLAKLVEQVIKTTPTSDLYAELQDVPCDACTGKKLKAVKSCLQCVVSFCENHLKPHRDVLMLQKHNLVPPSHKLQENICHEHNEVKKTFCITDQMAICAGCGLSQHKGHSVVASADERATRQASLEVDVDLLKNRVLLKEADLRRLHEKNQYSSQSAMCAEVQCTNAFAEMTNLLKNMQIEVLQHINSQLCRERRLNNIIHQNLGKEVMELKKSISELEKVAKVQDPNHFLLLYPSAPNPPSAEAQAEARPPTAKEDPAIDLSRPPMDFDYVSRAMKTLRAKFPLSLSEFKLPQPEVPLPALEPVTRQDLLRHCTGPKHCTLTDVCVKQ